MDNLAGFFILVLVFSLYFWRLVLKAILWAFVPRSYSLQGEILDLWQQYDFEAKKLVAERSNNFIGISLKMKKITYYSYFVLVKIFDENEVRIEPIEVSPECYKELKKIEKAEVSYCKVRCREFEWDDETQIIGIA